MVRTANLSAVNYAPGIPPQNNADLQRFLFEELQRISAAINALSAGHLDNTNVAPSKPREGDIRLCDGTNWNPLGTGQKFVGYRGGAWVLLG